MRLGLVVNPIAGMGGAVGLKGTDTPEILSRARALGAQPRAALRAGQALQVVAAALGGRVTVLAPGGAMGEDAARAAGLAVEPLPGGGAAGETGPGETGPADTERAAAALAAAGVELLLFCGGDGTARDVCRAIGERLPAVGIPAGVKMHSAAYATGPRAAGELAVRFLADGRPVRPPQVMDIDEDAFRAGAVAARLYGYLAVPYHRELLQGAKAGRVNSEPAALDAIAAEVGDRLRPGRVYLLGPGSTTAAIAGRLGWPKTLLGVDAYADGTRIAADAGEAALLAAIAGRPATAVVTPIGGQGHVLGRGNQQLGPALIRAIGRAGLVVVATPQKLASLQGRPLRVDTGDPALDADLVGHVRVITGYRTEAVCPVAA
ncbi:MAG: ATP-NAD kinase family protein [Dongiaceae bacterium]